MTTIDIYRNVGGAETLLKTIKPDESSTQLRKVMGENQLNLTFEMNEKVKFQINDYCSVFGEVYQLFELPVVTKLSVYRFKYSMTMKSQVFLLNNYNYLFYDNLNELRDSEFSLMGNAETFLDLLIANANRVGSGWTKGEVQTTAYKVIDFSKLSCYNALVRVAEEFETEFTIIGKTIHLIKRQNDTGHIFKVGKFKGLYEITRNNIDSTGLVTRMYAYGSERNLPHDYYSNRLRFPGPGDQCLIHNLTAVMEFTPGITQTYTFAFDPATGPNVTGLNIQYRIHGSSDPWTDDIGVNDSPRVVVCPAGWMEFRFVTIATGLCDGAMTDVAPIADTFIDPLFPNIPIPYLEKNADLYGVIEHTEIFDDVYPTRTGKVSSVNVGNIYELTDTSIDFDLNSYLLPGMTPKIVFNTGQLAGYEFEISSYNHGTKQIRILKNKDERVLDLPNSTMKPAIGDEYVLVDIRLPHRYVYEAEKRLMDKAQELLDQNAIPQVSYKVVVDPVYMRLKSLSMSPNDLVWIVDAQFGIERKIRVLSVTRNIVNEYDYQVELSDVAQASTLTRVVNSITANERNVSGVQNQLVNRSIFNNNIIGDVKILQGTIVANDLPETSTTVGFLPLYVEIATGKVYKKV